MIRSHHGMPETLHSSPEHKGNSFRFWLSCFLAILCIGMWIYWDANRYLQLGLENLTNLGPWGPALFVALYAIATVFLIPGSLLTLGAGAIFGLAWGCVWVSIGSTLGATGAFLVGRHLARNAVARRIEKDARFLAIDHAIESQGWRIVILTRLSPIFPFTLLNYAFGLTRIRFTHYWLASWIGMMPGTVMYVYLGVAAGDAAGVRGDRSPVEWMFRGLGLVATIGVTFLITRIARNALNARLNKDK